MSTAAVKKTRNSSVEILRVIAMLIIIISHFSVHGVNDNIPLTELKPCFNRYLLQSVPLGALGVDIFMLITGYFGIKTTFRIQKVFRLILQVFFYSVVIFVISAACGLTDFSLKETVNAFFPTITRKYWFFTAYIAVYLLSPLINRFLNSISRKQHIIIIAVFMIIYRILPLLTGFSIQATDFIAVYVIGAYLRLYPDNFLAKKKYRIPVLAVALIFTFASVAAINTAARFWPQVADQYLYFYNRESLNIIIAAAELVIIFSDINMGDNRIINTVSSCTFGVYLIHDNECIREFLWNRIIHAADFVYSDFLFLYILFTAFAIFISCAAIDYIRQKTIEIPATSAVNIIYNKTKQKAVEFYDKKSYRK